MKLHGNARLTPVQRRLLVTRVLEEHWTRQDPAVYEEESALVGDLDRLDTPQKQVTIGTAGSSTRVKQMLDRMRQENPDEPFWRGVESVTESAGGVEVACVLYPDQGEG